MDEVLGQPVLAREAHRAELAVHPTGEAAVGVDPAAQPIPRLEDRDLVAGFLEEQPRRQSRDPGADDDDVPTWTIRRWEAALQDVEEINCRGHEATAYRGGRPAFWPLASCGELVGLGDRANR